MYGFLVFSKDWTCYECRLSHGKLETFKTGNGWRDFGCTLADVVIQFS